MFILGIKGSPRTNGNSNWLLASFLKECEQLGAITQTIDTCKADILPCRELIVCETKGYCPLKDEMEKSLYALIRKADVVVLASPVFFYNVSAQVKTLIDRCQMFWGRKYKLKLTDPFSYTRQGFLLSVAASGGKKLFDGIHLTAKYFFDAISAQYQGSLTYKRMEGGKEIRSHSSVPLDIKKAAHDLCRPFLTKKTVLFISRHDACRGQIAGALARIHFKGRIRVITAGYDVGAGDRIVSNLIPAMAKRHIDLLYQIPQRLEDFTPQRAPEWVIFLGKEKKDVKISNTYPKASYENWSISKPADPSLETLETLIKELESKINSFASAVPEDT